MLTKISDEQKHISRLRIEITHSSESNSIAEIIANHVNKFPNLTITIITDVVNNLYEMLENYELYIDVVEGKRLSTKLNYYMLDTDYLVCVLNKNHYLTKYETITINDLKKRKYDFTSSNLATRQLFEATLTSINESINNFNIPLEIDNVNTIKELVRKNIGISVLPKSVRIKNVNKGKLSILSIQNLNMMREINIVYNKDFDRLNILNEIIKLYQSIVN